MKFSMYEIHQELRKFKHGFGIDEIREALVILHTSIVEITKVDGRSKQILSSSAFPALALRRQNEKDEACLEFNPLVRNAIKQLRYRHMNYEMMRLKNPLARRLYKRLCQTIIGLREGKLPVVPMTATQITRDSGFQPRARERDTLGRIPKAVKELVKHGIIEPLEPEVVKKGRAKVDLVFEFVPSARFLCEIRKSDLLAADAKKRVRDNTGVDEPDTFVRVPRPVSYQASEDRRPLFLLEG